MMERPANYALLNLASFQPPYGNAAPGRGYHNHGLHRDLSMPDYAKLAANAPLLAPRSCGTDPPSPLRDCGSFYLVQAYSAELMGTLSTATPNLIREDAEPRPDSLRLESTLDTLYFTVGGTAPYGRPVMTYYHGFDSPQMVFSGFPLWHFQKDQARALADFVLQDIFRLSKPGAITAAGRPRVAATVAPNPPPRGRLLRSR